MARILLPASLLLMACGRAPGTLPPTDSHSPEDSAPPDDTGDDDTGEDTNAIQLTEREDGRVGFQITGTADALDAIWTEVRFYQDTVTIRAELDPTQMTGVVPFIPVRREDAPMVQEYFEAQDGTLQADVRVVARGPDGEQEATLSVGFRQWQHASEGDCALNAACQQADADLQLPTEVWAIQSAVAEGRLGGLSDLVTARIHQQQQQAGPNYSVVMLEATGTPLQVTMVSKDALEATGEVDVSEDIQGGYHLWWQGRELAITNGYPNRDGHASVIAVFDDQEQLLTAVNPEADGLLLHHDGFIHSRSTLTQDDEVEVYGIAWESRDNGRSLGQKSTIVRFRMDSTTGQPTAGSLQTLFDVDDVMEGITYAYGNSISLSPCGADGSCWMGFTFANDTGYGEPEDESRHAMVVAQTLEADGPAGTPLIFVNDDLFDESRLIDPDRGRFIGLPPDPTDGQVPLDHIHKVKLFREADSERTRYRLILGALVRAANNADGDKRSRMFVYTIDVPDDPEEDATVSWVCGATIDTYNQSHMDIQLPPNPHEHGVLALGTANPHGETYYLAYDGQVAAGTTDRCQLVARHGLRDADKDASDQTAVNTWQKTVDLRHLAPGLLDASVTINVDQLSAAYAPLE